VAEAGRAGLGDHQLVEVTVTVGATWLLNRMATGLRLPTSDETFTKLGELGFAGYEPGGRIDRPAETMARRGS
jgi:hypothetical protein